MTPVRDPSRHARAASSSAALLLLALAVSGSGASAQAAADITVGLRPVTQEKPDSLRPPISPGRAFLHSFLLPGLGQARLQRQGAGALYFTLESVAVAMLVKSMHGRSVARQGLARVVIGRYRTDPATGFPVYDNDGNPLPADTVENRYSEARLKARRTHVEDWIAILVFNHLFAGADAFVSSLLWDLPARVGLHAGPAGLRVGVSLRR